MFEADLLDDVLTGISEGWSSGTYGDTLVHDECGEEIEMDCMRCPACGVESPLYGLI